mgnify:CR=1 FL=1
MKLQIFFLLLFLAILSSQADTLNIISINFNSGVDSHGNSNGLLHFTGSNGFEVYFTDDDSNGSYGGNANGVHISNQNYGNAKVGTSDLVLGAYNSYNGSYNYHSSGIIASFNQGARKVSFDDTDDDSTVKALFAYDQYNNLIGQSPFASRTTVVIDTTMTNGALIYKVEFDTAAGTAGGSYDGTYFTIDNFYAEAYVEQVAAPPGINVPELSTWFMILPVFFALIFKKMKK